MIVWTALLLGSFPVKAQVRKLTYADTLQYHKLTPDAAIIAVQQWYNAYTSDTPTSAEQQQRKQLGNFTGTSAFKYVSKVASGNEYTRGTIYFTMKVKVNEDNTYSYELSNFTHQARISFNLLTTREQCPYKLAGDKLWQNMVWKDIKEQIRQKMLPVIAELTAAMQTQNSAGSK